MADVKISGLPSDSSLDSNHYVPVNDPTGPTTKRTLLSTLAAFFFSQTNIPDGSGSPRTRDSEMGKNYVVSGGVWSGDAYASTRNASMTALVCYINGRRLTVSAVTASSFTASKDTYIDVLDNADGTATLVYTEVSNNAASPSLAANSLRLGTVVTGATNIAAATSIGQGGFANTVPVISSQIFRGFDSLGNLIYPKGPVSPVLTQNPYKFSVYRAAAHNSAGSYTKVDHDTTLFDTGNNVATNDKFTAPVAGYYWFHAVAGNTVAGATPIFSALYVNGSQRKIGSGANTASNGSWSAVSGLLQLSAGDYVEHYFIGGGGSVMEVGQTKCYFEGFLHSAS